MHPEYLPEGTNMRDVGESPRSFHSQSKAGDNAPAPYPYEAKGVDEYFSAGSNGITEYCNRKWDLNAKLLQEYALGGPAIKADDTLADLSALSSDVPLVITPEEAEAVAQGGRVNFDDLNH